MLEIIQNEYAAILAGGIGGVITAWLTQRILNKRGTFTYLVTHNRIGVTSDDAIFGKVAVTWNENPIANLYLSTVELKNESMNDYENVIVSAYTDDTNLLTERTHILDTPNILEHSPKYKEQLFIEEGGTPTEAQKNTYNSRREYLIPIFNRGQTASMTYLNAAKTSDMPTIWLSVIQKGVKLKFKRPQNEILGVPQPRAALAGLLVGILVVSLLLYLLETTWLIASASFAFGLVAQLPGAYTVKAVRALRELIGG